MQCKSEHVPEYTAPIRAQTRRTHGILRRASQKPRQELRNGRMRQADEDCCFEFLCGHAHAVVRTGLLAPGGEILDVEAMKGLNML